VTSSWETAVDPTNVVDVVMSMRPCPGSLLRARDSDHPLAARVRIGDDADV
jgi:hypothetical protein